MLRRDERGNAWGIGSETERPPRYWVEYGVGFLLFLDALTVPAVPLEIPVSEVAAIVLIVVGVTRRPLTPLLRSWWFIPLLVAGWAYLVAVSVVNDVDFGRRAFRLAVLGILIVFAASGRLSVPHLVRGLGVGLLINVVLFYVGLTPAAYGRYLTGFLGDKNVAGLLYAVIGISWAGLQKSHRLAMLIWVLFGIAVFLTGSRTSMSAYALAAAWLYMRATWAVPVRLAALTAGIWILGVAEERFARLGMFADRTGTDWFRERINEAAAHKLAQTPWYGGGLGTAIVELGPDRRMFFHNSFDGLRAEGGWPLLGVVLLVYVVLIVRPLRDTVATRAELYAEAAAIAVLICAWKLGEVLLATWTFLVIAPAIQAYESSFRHAGEPSGGP